MNPRKPPREFIVIDNTDNSGFSAREADRIDREFFIKHDKVMAVNTFYCREVLPDEITDTDRLEWMIESKRTILKDEEGYWVTGTYPSSGSTPRAAIDAAMAEEKR